MPEVSGKWQNLPSVAARFERKATEYSPSMLGAVSTHALASELAGTTDRKSSAYKAAARNFQRYKQGTRRPRASTQAKIQKVIRRLVKRDAALRAKMIGAILVTIKGRIRYSDDERERTVSATFGDWESGAWLAAARTDSAEAERSFFEKYGAPGMMVVSGRVTIKTVKE